MTDFAKVIVYVPLEKHHLLGAHVKALGTTMSRHARDLLMADLNSAPSIAPEIETER